MGVGVTKVICRQSLNSASLMPVILLLTIHLIAYQQLHDKGACFLTLLWQLLPM